MRRDYDIVRSRRRTVSVEIKEDLTVLVRAPMRMPVGQIDSFVDNNREWIRKHIEKVRKQNEEIAEAEPIKREEVIRLGNEAACVIPQKVRYFAQLLGVTYGGITIRNQKSLWGSCSAKGDLNFNCMLMKAPERVQDYVVIHELCHRREMNHSKRFWDIVASVMPDYKKCRKWLKEEGTKVLSQSLRNIEQM